MPLPQIPLDDPRVLALAKARQQLAHDCAFLPTWDELTDEERKDALPTVRSYLESAINAGLVSADQDGPHMRVMAKVLRDVWKLAEKWARDDDTEPLAADIFTAFSTLLAWETEQGVPHTV